MEKNLNFTAKGLDNISSSKIDFIGRKELKKITNNTRNSQKNKFSSN